MSNPKSVLRAALLGAVALSSAALALNYRAVDVSLKFDDGPLTVGVSNTASPTLGVAKPEIRGGVAYVGASHGSGAWAVGLSPKSPLALHVQQESGSLDMNLRGLPLTALSLSMGAGPTTLKLPGATFAGKLTQESGSLDIHVPADTGVRLNIVKFESGSLDIDGKNVSVGGGLKGTYQTANFAVARRQITLTLDWGSGPVTVYTPGQ